MKVDGIITGKTGLIGVIGNPIGHSISPQLHNTISRHLGKDLVYIPMKVEHDFLKEAVNGLKALNFIGFNITIPHKNDIISCIDECDKDALLMGAVNTVRITDGRLYGFNTDANGFARSFMEEAGTGFKGMDAVVLGAGGTARAIAVKLALDGARSIHLINRTLSKSCEIADIINNNIRDIAKASVYENPEAIKAFNDSSIIINTTSLGMHPNVDGTPMSDGFIFSRGQIVYDVVYNPVRTKFLMEAEEKGCKTINGMGMLFYQGIYAYEIWTGVKLEENILKEAFEAFITILGS